MKKIKMFGLAFLVMMFGVFNVSALDLNYSFSSETGNKITYNIADGESLSYQIVKITKEEYNKVEATLEEENENLAIDDMLSSENVAKLQEYQEKIEEAEAKLEAATEEEKDAAQAELDELNKEYIAFVFGQCFADIMKYLSDSYAKLVPYVDDDASWTEYTEKSGEISVDMSSASENDVYFLYLKGTDMSTGTPIEFTRLGGIFTKDGETTTPVVPEVPTENPSTSDTTETPSTKEEIENPKTGVNMPIALGVGALVLAGLGIFVVYKKQVFKQL